MEIKGPIYQVWQSRIFPIQGHIEKRGGRKQKKRKRVLCSHDVQARGNNSAAPEMMLGTFWMEAWTMYLSRTTILDNRPRRPADIYLRNCRISRMCSFWADSTLTLKCLIRKCRYQALPFAIVQVANTRLLGKVSTTRRPRSRLHELQQFTT